MKSVRNHNAQDIAYTFSLAPPRIELKLLGRVSDFHLMFLYENDLAFSMFLRIYIHVRVVCPILDCMRFQSERDSMQLSTSI